MLKKLLIFAVVLTGGLSASAQWTLSGGNVGEKQFTEKSDGVYELSLPGDTIYGRFVLKNGSETRYGAANTYVCGGVPYTLATEGDSLMMGSSIVNPVLTLDTSGGTLTATGNVQPLFAYGDLRGKYWLSLPGEPDTLVYQGNGIYTGKNIEMFGHSISVIQKESPSYITTSSERGDYIAHYRFSAVKTTQNIEWGTPVPMARSIRNQELNFLLPDYNATVNVEVNLLNVTFEATGGYSFSADRMYLISSNATKGNKQTKWNDDGCNSGLLMDYDLSDQVATFTISDVKVQSITDDPDDPRGDIKIVSSLGSWEKINAGYALGSPRTPKQLTLGANSSVSTGVNDAGQDSQPFSIPSGTYDFTLEVQPSAPARLTAVQTSTSGIDEVTDDKFDISAPVEWFDLNGHKISEPTKSGVYIRRQGDRSNKTYILYGENN